MDDATTKLDLYARYAPVAVYYEDADTVEYIRQDVPCVNRRVDGFLTLTLDMTSRQPIGFRLKGFKNFYLRHIKAKDAEDRDQFLKLVEVIEKAIEVAGNKVFEKEAREAYAQARQIAKEDDAALHELPDAA
jgi:hypothetical protein